jgi:hypothetical protein
METKVITMEDREPVDLTRLKEAGEILRRGGLVAFPTETVYGLGGNALDKEASQRIYAAKGRPSDNPLIVHIAEWEELSPLVQEVPELAKRLASLYWPGPMTLIFKKRGCIPYATSGGLDTVAIRMPSDPIARALIRSAGVPVAAPSANTSGRPSPTSAQHVLEDLRGAIDLVIDGGEVAVGLESTIVDLTGDVPTLLRPGAVTAEMLRRAIGTLALDPALTRPLAEGVHPKAPGMKYRHYAPRAEMTLVEGEREQVIQTINRLAADAIAAGKKVGVIATDENRGAYRFGDIKWIGDRANEAKIAHNLFSVLRAFDADGVDLIYSESIPEHDLGYAIMNRMNKAAGHRHIKAEKTE